MKLAMVLLLGVSAWGQEVEVGPQIKAMQGMPVCSQLKLPKFPCLIPGMFPNGWAIVSGIAPYPPPTKRKRSSSIRSSFQRLHPCPSTESKVGACPGWVVDHTIALACGGLDAPENMSWMTVADAKTKDKWERKGCRK